MTPDEQIQYEEQRIAEIQATLAASKLARENREMLQAVPEDVEILLDPVPEHASGFEKLEIEQGNNRRVVDAVNHPELEPKKPKYGSGIAVPVDLEDGTTVYVDSTYTNVDTGKRYDYFPSHIKQYIDQQIEKRRDELSQKFLEDYNRPKEPHTYYAMTKEEYEVESEKEYPVYTLPKQTGPAWDDSILYGLAGDVIHKASEYCESHPAGMLVDLLVSIGSIIGHKPYFSIGASKHYCNEFMCRVGDSAKSRKGTGRDQIDGILRQVDPTWFSDRIESGFGSAEAIIGRVRDSFVDSKFNHKTKEFESVTIPGVDDKRLCIREGEIASVWVLASKSDSRASIVLRDGWDGKPLHNTVKGRSGDGFSNSAKCEEPHISISGDTTIHELRQKLPTGADENGFGNRFMFVYVYRVKDCPQGGPPIDWDEEIVDFQKVIKFAKSVKHVSMSNGARKWWNKKYSDMENNGLEGLAGKMTRRGAAHLRRIAMLYALLDMKDQIELEHFQAAEKLWNYCEESAMFIFGGLTKDQLLLVNWIGQRGEVSYQQVRDKFYHRNQPVAKIKAELEQLASLGRLVSRAAGVYAVPNRG